MLGQGLHDIYGVGVDTFGFYPVVGNTLWLLGRHYGFQTTDVIVAG